VGVVSIECERFKPSSTIFIYSGILLCAALITLAPSPAMACTCKDMETFLPSASVVAVVQVVIPESLPPKDSALGSEGERWPRFRVRVLEAIRGKLESNVIEIDNTSSCATTASVGMTYLIYYAGNKAPWLNMCSVLKVEGTRDRVVEQARAIATGKPTR
jgi:hypothetical protein